ncbi:MAG: efflux RND transporter periplasmic adaptor subunit [Firmicutes bacterium]|nr:efflux RND transporter periplasmic adaptor subunit [Bacillota bacterium]
MELQMGESGMGQREQKRPEAGGLDASRALQAGAGEAGDPGAGGGDRAGAGAGAGAPRPVKGRVKGWLLAGAVLAVLIGVPLAVRFLRGEAPVAEQGPGAVPVEVAAVARRDVSRAVRLTGRVAPRVEIKVLPKIAGRIKSIEVDVGDRVRAGQVLVRLDDAEIAAQVRQAEAALAVAEAGARAAAANLEDARRNLERMKQLYEAGAVPLQQLEQAQLRYDQAAAGVSEAQVAQARAALEAARVQLANTVITAPAGGIVAARSAQVGEMAAPTQPLLTLIDIDQVQVEVSVTEAEVNRLRPGQEVPVTVAAVSEKPLTGRIASLAPAADPRSKMFPVKITLSNPGHRLKPGMFAEVSLTAEVRRQVLVVPVGAVLEKEGRAVVYVVEGGRARERRVEAGLSDGKFTEIKKGLREGEQVVVSGQEFLVDGARVAVKGALS